MMQEEPVSETTGGPLSGVVVFDFTRHLSGPFATQILRDLGANVVKFEPPKGDPARRSEPFSGKDSAYFDSINRGKESVVIDFHDPEDVKQVLELLPRADCVVENFRPGVMEAMGLGAQACLEVNPQLIYAACSGFGADGPYANRPAFDVVIQAMGGVMSVTGERDGPPTRVGVSQGDIVAGIYVALAILAALHDRTRTGTGTVIDVSMMEAQFNLMTHAFGIWSATGSDPTRNGSRHPAVAPFDVFRVTDGYVAVGVVKDDTFVSLCKALDRPELLEDERFTTRRSRLANVDALTEVLGPVFASYTTEELIAQLNAVSVPCGPVLTVSEILRDPHVAHREAISSIPYWGESGLAVPGLPFRLGGHRPVVTDGGPDLGDLTMEELVQRLKGSAEQGRPES